MSEFNKERERVLQKLGGRLVDREVYVNVGSLVQDIMDNLPEGEFMEAYEESEYSCFPNYWTTCESCEIERVNTNGDGLCDSCDPVEVYEWWAVSSWLADKLRARGEIVIDYGCPTVWGRQTTGQAILLDGVIREIAVELWPEELKETA